MSEDQLIFEFLEVLGCVLIKNLDSFSIFLEKILEYCELSYLVAKQSL